MHEEKTNREMSLLCYCTLSYNILCYRYCCSIRKNQNLEKCVDDDEPSMMDGHLLLALRSQLESTTLARKHDPIAHLDTNYHACVFLGAIYLLQDVQGRAERHDSIL